MQHPYLPHTPEERQRMLAALGLASQEELLAPIPPGLRRKDPLPLAPSRTEVELEAAFRVHAERNADLLHHPCFLGAGSYQHHVPAVIDHLAGRGEFATAYTPYQPEMSQGMLQAIFEFQTMIAELCGMPAANASLYDGATAVAEAVLLALAATGRRKVLVARSLHPDYRAVLRTYLRFRPVELTELPLGDGRLAAEGLPLDEEAAALVCAYPNFLGQIEDLAPLSGAAHAAGALCIVAANPLALGLLEAPGHLGADVVVGEGQWLGSAPSFGGPGLGFIACRDEFVRRLPGRLVGQTTDARGRRGFVLTLQTREQHIRREKATSNICSNAALMALRAAIYLAVMGPSGLAAVAGQCMAGAHYTSTRLTQDGPCAPVFTGPFFHEFALRCPVAPARVNAALWERGILGGLDLGGVYPELGQTMLFCVTEMRTVGEIETLVEVMEAIA